MGMGIEQQVGLRIAVNRDRQRDLYGSTLGDQVRWLTSALDITQARLARTLGMSPAMLSQLVSGRRVKIGDPTVLARLLMLDQRCSGAPSQPEPQVVDALLAEVARAHWQWTRPASARGRDRVEQGSSPSTAIDALRTVATPARLAAAAATLRPAFPELAEILRQAAVPR
ncbi:MAG: helix-turn-helix domain-containing protein [Pseudonocardia sp.]